MCVCVCSTDTLLSQHLPLLSWRNWLSSHCQVCLIFPWLTSCYLESHLPEALNPLVTHDNKKLGKVLCEWRQGGAVLWVHGRVGLGGGGGDFRSKGNSACQHLLSWRILTERNSRKVQCITDWSTETYRYHHHRKHLQKLEYCKKKKKTLQD